MSKFAVILPAAGMSARFGDKNYKKPFVPLHEKAVWLHAAEHFLHRDDVVQTIVVIAPEDREFFNMKFGANIAIMGITVVDGGSERFESVQHALDRVVPAAEFVAIHDAARPCIADVWISKVFAAAVKHDAAMLAIPVSETLKRSRDGRTVDETVARDGLWLAQTPQVFRRALLEKAYAARGDFRATDDAQLVERLGHTVTIVPGSTLNLKITTRDDLQLAAAALKSVTRVKFGTGAANPLDDMWR